MTGAPLAAGHLTEAQLGELAGGAPAGAGPEAAERHLAACDRCRRDLEETRALLALARDARRDVAAPPELWPLVAALTVHRAPVRRQVLRSMRGVLLLAAAALVLGTAAVTVAVTGWLQRPAAPVVVPQPPIPPQPPMPPEPPEPPAGA